MIQVIPAFFALVVAGGLVVPPAPAVQAPDAAGTWDVVFNTPNGARKGKLVLKRDGETLTGVAVAENAAEYNIEGQQKGADVSMRFTYTADTSIPITMKGTVKGDTMSGTATFGSDPGDWTATRSAAAGAPAAGTQAALDISGAWVFEVTTAAGSGSPAVTFPRFLARASSSPCVAASMATGMSGSGMSQGATSSGSSLAEIVSPVSAVPSLVSAQISPATQKGTGRSPDPSGEYRWVTRSSLSWSSWPRSAIPRPPT